MTHQQCALLSLKKMEQTEKCSVPYPKQSSQPTSNQSQGWRKRQIARLLDPHYVSLTQLSTSGEASVGTQSNL
jgi:hypothetical protein